MADIKTAYGSSSNLTITLASLATDANLLAGRESTAVSNTTNLYEDYILSGFITTGTSPTVNTGIRIYLYASLDDTPTYPDVLDGTDSDETLTSAEIRNAGLSLVQEIIVSATSDAKYYIEPTSVAQWFGGVMPKNFGVFVVHNTGVSLNATGSNHQITVTPVYQTVA